MSRSEHLDILEPVDLELKVRWGGREREEGGRRRGKEGR
jgi:hypothetical protein